VKDGVFTLLKNMIDMTEKQREQNWARIFKNNATIDDALTIEETDVDLYNFLLIRTLCNESQSLLIKMCIDYEQRLAENKTAPRK
jgi:hypothetical protein